MWKLLQNKAINQRIMFIILEIKHIRHGNGNGRYNTFKHMITKGKTLLKHIPHESHYNSCKFCLLLPAKFTKYTSIHKAQFHSIQPLKVITNFLIWSLRLESSLGGWISSKKSQIHASIQYPLHTREVTQPIPPFPNHHETFPQSIKWRIRHLSNPILPIYIYFNPLNSFTFTFWLLQKSNWKL